MPSELNGIVVVDKPGGVTSAGVVASLKRRLGAKKVGHTGTLDPFATGVLICCINRATRLSRFFLQGDKAYEAELVLGIATDTQDATGTIIERHPVGGITSEQVCAAARRFVGPITQVPPVYSALKHRGTPLYKLARRGKAVQKPARKVRVHRLNILDVHLPSVRLFVSCSSGTYIRTLCHDMGKRLGCGAHLTKLRRVAGSGFTLDDAVDFQRLIQRTDPDRLRDVVIPMRHALPFMPSAVADAKTADKIRNGKKLGPEDLAMPPRPRADERVKVVDDTGRLVAVLEPAATAEAYNYCCVFSS